MTLLKSPFCLMTTSTLLPISTLIPMSQEQIEDLTPQEYSLFLADGEFCNNPYSIAPHNVVSFLCESEIHTRVLWV